MNSADFNTQPNGFPLESDSTLGFMQSDYQDAIRALAKAMGNDNAILTGLEIINGIANDGWILYDGDVVFFQGGTVSTHFIIETTVIAKANQNGQSVDRYFIKKARFGTGANQVAFTLLTRIASNLRIGSIFNMFGNAGNGFGVNWIILNGLKPLGDGIDSGTAIFANKVINASAYNSTVVNENNPIYLTSVGEWTEMADTNHLKFEPRTTRRLDIIHRKNSTKIGAIKWFVTSELDLSFFDNGLGKWDYDGFAVADGNNDTFDLSGTITGLTALQRI